MMTDTVQCGVIAFDLRNAQTPDDAKIEAMVQRLVEFSVKKAKKHDLSFADLVCASVEYAARLCASAATFKPASPEADDKLVADLTNNFRNRMRDAMQGKAPSAAAGIHPH
jgi:hypothetical protein